MCVCCACIKVPTYFLTYLKKITKTLQLLPSVDTTTALCQSYTIRCDTRCYFNVRWKADVSQLNLPHGNDN